MNCCVNPPDYFMYPHTNTRRDIFVDTFPMAQMLGELLCITQLRGDMTDLEPRLSHLSWASILHHSHRLNKPYIIHLIYNNFHVVSRLICWRYKNCLRHLNNSTWVSVYVEEKSFKKKGICVCLTIKCRHLTLISKKTYSLDIVKISSVHWWYEVQVEHWRKLS